MHHRPFVSNDLFEFRLATHGASWVMDDEGHDPVGGAGTAGEWAVVCAIVVLTVAILLPPMWNVLVHASDSPLPGWPTVLGQMPRL